MLKILTALFKGKAKQQSTTMVDTIFYLQTIVDTINKIQKHHTSDVSIWTLEDLLEIEKTLSSGIKD